jgi:hypothetical protein
MVFTLRFVVAVIIFEMTSKVDVSKNTSGTNEYF